MNAHSKHVLRYPPIAALRAFEAATRHKNFTKAALELHVTQSAISHQIKHIETLWGFKLFIREGRGLKLTEQAEQLVPVIGEFFSSLNQTLRQIHSNTQDEGYIKIGLSQSFALKWMVPRLGEFSHQHPDTDVTISTLSATRLLDLDKVDLAIEYRNSSQHTDLNIIVLLHEYSFPVCSPGFLKNQVSSLKKAHDLLNLPLLRRLNVDGAPRWINWFSAAGIDKISLPKGIHFPNSSMALQAAIDSQGVALARSAHVADDLASGKLVKLLDTHVQNDLAYCLICDNNKFSLPSVQNFIAWIKDEAVDSQELFDQQAKAHGKTKQSN